MFLKKTDIFIRNSVIKIKIKLKLKCWDNPFALCNIKSEGHDTH